MKDAQDMTPKEAQAYLVKLQKKTRQRQQNYVKRKQAEGHRRINTFINAEAAEILDSEIDEGQTIADIVSDALIVYSRHKRIRKPIQHSVTTDDPPTIPVFEYDQESTEGRIAELADQGMGPADIARRLEAEGFPTPTGRPKWQRTTISRIIQRVKG